MAQKLCKILLQETENSERTILPDSDKREEEEDLLITQFNPPRVSPPQQPQQLQEPKIPLNPPDL